VTIAHWIQVPPAAGRRRIASTEPVVGRAAAPAVTSVTPSTATTEVGTTDVKIMGTGFTGVTSIQFGIVVVNSTDVCSGSPSHVRLLRFVNDGEIDATTPPDAHGTVHVTVTTPRGGRAPRTPTINSCMWHPDPRKLALMFTPDQVAHKSR
jgi:hypothetical protein